jgi:hypothetical protein
MANVMQVTGVESNSQSSLFNGQKTISTIEASDIFTVDFTSSSTDLYNGNMKTPSIQETNSAVYKYLFPHSVTKKHSVESMNQVSTPSVSSMMEPKRVILLLLLGNQYRFYSSSSIE